MHPVEVAFYEQLRFDASQHQGTDTGTSASIPEALELVSQLQAKLDVIKGNLSPKTVTDKTDNRARALIPSLKDAAKLIGAAGTGETEQ